MADRLAPDKRHSYIVDGRLIYEWDQTLDDVDMYIQLPPAVPANCFTCQIGPHKLTVGIKGNPPYMDHELGGVVMVSDSFWTIEDGAMHITLQKRERGQPWASALVGHGLDALSANKDQERLMLERFQRENPGFDFSTATFSGIVPNPKDFMGGMKSA